MKLRICLTNGKPTLVLSYKPGEWSILEEQWRRLGLEKFTSSNLWGEGIQGDVYRDREGRMEDFLRDLFSHSSIRYQFYSDINSPIFRDGRVNIGILRFVPDENYEVYVPLPKFVTIDELVTIRDTLAEAVRLVLSVVVDMECEVIFQINGRRVE
jgi:hypothetical protein